MAFPSETDRQALSVAMRLSLVIGLLMFVIKVGAYLLTGSAAILGDAAESVVQARQTVGEHVFAVGFKNEGFLASARPDEIRA